MSFSSLAARWASCLLTVLTVRSHVRSQPARETWIKNISIRIIDILCAHASQHEPNEDVHRRMYTLLINLSYVCFMFKPQVHRIVGKSGTENIRPSSTIHCVKDSFLFRIWEVPGLWTRACAEFNDCMGCSCCCSGPVRLWVKSKNTPLCVKPGRRAKIMTCRYYLRSINTTWYFRS